MLVYTDLTVLSLISTTHTSSMLFYSDLVMWISCADMLLGASTEDQAKCQVDIKEWFVCNQKQRKDHRGIVLSGMFC